MGSPNENAPDGEQTSVSGSARALPAAPKAGDSGRVADAVRDAAALYRENFEFVWRNARRLGCSDEWVDDAVHEVFLVATRRLPEFEGRSSPRTWLFSITFRVVQRMQRDRARRRKHVERYVQESAGAESTNETEAAEYLRHLLQQLPEAQRAVVILAELEGFSTAEIADSLGVPRGTIDTRLRTARISLSRAIERDQRRDERLIP
jgi:RNA polymerase sigma-70 factor, ECF subfamily